MNGQPIRPLARLGAGVAILSGVRLQRGPDGKLKSSTELRNLKASGEQRKRQSPEQRQLEVMAARWPRKRQTPQQMQLALMREKAKWASEFG
jgi:hypothetical protein